MSPLLNNEDIWGKKVPPQWSVVFCSDNALSGVKSVSDKWCNKQKKMKEFTMEVWVKVKGGEGSLVRLMSSTETALEVRLQCF